MGVAVHWFRRDFRVRDNAALFAAAEHERDYPPPIVDHAAAKARAIAKFRKK